MSIVLFCLAFLIFSNISTLHAVPPNIVFILADDYGFHDIGYHNNDLIKTPNLDALASAGVKLENYYVQPICTPTRSQLMSGRYQVTIEHNHEAERERIGKEEVVQQLQGIVENDPSRPLKRAYNQVAGRREDRGQDVPPYDTIRTRLSRTRARHMPEIPRTIEEVEIGGEWRTTWNGHRFLSLVDNAAGVSIFVTRRCLQILSEIHTGLQHDIIWPPQPHCLPLSDPTLADKLTEAGYESHMTGKWHLGFYKRACWPTNRGFKSFLGYLGGAEDYYTHVNYYQFSFDEQWRGLDFRDGLEPASNYTGIYSTLVFAQRAQTIIEQHNKQKPLFLYVPFQAVHAPMKVPASYREQYKFIKDTYRQIYAGMTTCMDEAVGNITDTLKKEGLWDNTILIFSSDNGGPVPRGANNWPLRGWKGSLWEGGTHAVGFVSSPLLPEEVKGTINRELIHISDWFPTLVEGVAGWNLNGTKLDGFNVWDTISQGVASPRFELLHNIDPLGNPQINMSTPPIPSCNFTGPTQFNVSIRAAIRYKDWKLITGNPGNGSWIPPPESGEKPVVHVVPPGKCVWLFNIKNDPYEYFDLSDEQGDVVEFLLDRLYFYQKGAKPVHYPDPDPHANPALHNNNWDSWE